MSDKAELYDCKGEVMTYDAAVMLRKLADGLAQGKIEMACEKCGALCVDVPGMADIELSVKEKAKSGGLKRKLEIELQWKIPAPASEE